MGAAGKWIARKHHQAAGRNRCRKRYRGCALFPIELFRIGHARVVAAADDGDLYAREWTRYDRDMLRCFEGEITGGASMFETQRPVLERVFTQAEMALLEGALARLKRD